MFCTLMSITLRAGCVFGNIGGFRRFNNCWPSEVCRKSGDRGQQQPIFNRLDGRNVS